MKTAIIHYSAPPVVGGVEMVIQAHAEQFAAYGMPLSIIAGRGDASSFPGGVEFVKIEEMDSLHPEISSATEILNSGILPDSFDRLTRLLVQRLEPLLRPFDHVIIHNVLTKHFNLPLTAALFHLVDKGGIKNCIAWCHDLTWSSTRSRNKVFPEYPWDLLRKYNSRINYVAISEQRKQEVVDVMGCQAEDVKVLYNGVNPAIMLGLSPEISRLIEKIGVFSEDLILLMPVRVTRAKNVELAMKVVQEIKRSGLHPKLIITGPPDPHDPENMAYYRSLLDLRKTLELEKNVLFVYEFGENPDKGYILDRNEVSGLYRLADVMFMPSHREGFGMPLVEAAFLGMPVVSTDVPALKEIIGGNALGITPDMDPSELATNLLGWLAAKPDFANRVKMRQNFTWKSIFEKNLLPILKSENST